MTVVAVLAWLLPVTAAGQKGHTPTSTWWPEVREVDAVLRQQRWKSGLKQAKKLAEMVTQRSWYGPDLGRILAELALYQAVALANLESKREAVWYWQIAQNLDPGMRRRDLGAYGSVAARLFREFYLRQEREVPAGFEVRGASFGVALTNPELRKRPAEPEILNNTGALQDGSGDCLVELVIDERGELHHPVVVSTQRHPVVIYAVLRSLPELSPLKPATLEGEPVDALLLLTVRFHVVRW